VLNKRQKKLMAGISKARQSSKDARRTEFAKKLDKAGKTEKSNAQTTRPTGA